MTDQASRSSSIVCLLYFRDGKIREVSVKFPPPMYILVPVPAKPIVALNPDPVEIEVLNKEKRFILIGGLDGKAIYIE